MKMLFKKEFSLENSILKIRKFRRKDTSFTKIGIVRDFVHNRQMNNMANTRNGRETSGSRGQYAITGS
jgi:hypothetical protein